MARNRQDRIHAIKEGTARKPRKPTKSGTRSTSHRASHSRTQRSVSHSRGEF